MWESRESLRHSALLLSLIIVDRGEDASARFGRDHTRLTRRGRLSRAMPVPLAVASGWLTCA